MANVRDLLRFWFTLSSDVDRRSYLRHGTALIGLKYGIDVVLVWVGAGAIWTPLDYLQSVPLLLSSTLVESDPWLAPLLALWTLPFLWVGVTLTMRRLLDAGGSAWWALLFFVPYLAYGLALVLVLAPTSATAGRGAPVPKGERLPNALLSMAGGAALGLGIMWLGVLKMDSYGLALFMGAPFVIGMATAYGFCRRYAASARETLEVVVMTMGLTGGAAFVVGFEGIVCLAMVAPLGVVIAGMGALIGRELAQGGAPAGPGAAMVLVLLPAGLFVEAGANEAQLREVRSSVVVNEAPSDVWATVIAFPRLPEPTNVIFRLGLAYPVEARIEGSGVGAIRYCVFSTGAFVEPITAWEVNSRLAFDVTESPAPLRELSTRDIAPPHLEGYLAARRGEFRLVPLPGGRTLLEGSTWYEQRLRPEGYWSVFSDYVIGRIHDTVLSHIKAQVEAQSSASKGESVPAAEEIG